MKKRNRKPAAPAPWSFDRLDAFDDEGHLRVVVETPRGSTAKFVFDPAIGAFALSRALPAGITYPFDFGFVPQTLAEDGDPLDALVLHDGCSYPGIVIACTIVGVVEIMQNEERRRGRIRNDRLVVVPADDPTAAAEHGVKALTRRRKSELEAFFEASTIFEDKDVEVLRWAAARAAKDLVQKARANAK